jgi:hypothetical protein
MRLLCNIEGDGSFSWSQTIDVSLVNIRNSDRGFFVRWYFIWYLLYKSMGGYRLVKDSLWHDSLVESIMDFWGYGECKGTSVRFLTFPLFSSTLLYSPLLSHTHPCSYVHSPTPCTITRCQTLKADKFRTSKMLTRKLVDYYCCQHSTFPLRSYL